MPKISNYDARIHAANLDPFESHTGNMTGTKHTPGYYVPKGHLPAAYAERGHLEDADYIVWSYATPIAWHLPDGWVIPDVTYSITTSSKHYPYLPHSAEKSAHHLPSVRHLSPTVASIVRAARQGYGTSAEGRTRKTIDAVLATGEVILTNDGRDFYPKFLADKDESAPFSLV